MLRCHRDTDGRGIVVRHQLRHVLHDCRRALRRRGLQVLPHEHGVGIHRGQLRHVPDAPRHGSPDHPHDWRGCPGRRDARPGRFRNGGSGDVCRSELLNRVQRHLPLLV